MCHTKKNGQDSLKKCGTARKNGPHLEKLVLFKKSAKTLLRKLCKIKKKCGTVRKMSHN